MRDVNSFDHTRWECKYYIVFIPKYRKKVLFGQIRKELGEVFHRLAKQKESFNGKFRGYCLNQHWFASLIDARSTIEDWRNHYNHVRPHRSLGRKPPAVFAR